MWHQGQKLTLNSQKYSSSAPPEQFLLTYTAGIATMISTYFAITSIPLFPTSSTTPNHLAKQQQLPQQFIPPQTLSEFYHRAGKPTLVRLGAVSIGCFFAGVVQTYLAVRYSGGGGNAK
eukprot:CAMPEP_0172508136 /NCGR_PEP_ID=MMETSP1066-20121228/209523_1 /TAXON_ID=671091 /ORGANISM="Coscinodiscus wailesii, Strain CCMP2513" /LENGTH=118 /DNA_ID=CAMNT_0013285975 /DNA_START=1 /DNA_END=354 /DNA_ORIENTATION=-